MRANWYQITKYAPAILDENYGDNHGVLEITDIWYCDSPEMIGIDAAKDSVDFDGKKVTYNGARFSIEPVTDDADLNNPRRAIAIYPTTFWGWWDVGHYGKAAWLTFKRAWLTAVITLCIFATFDNVLRGDRFEPLRAWVDGVEEKIIAKANETLESFQ